MKFNRTAYRVQSGKNFVNIERSWCIQEKPEPLKYFAIEYSGTFQASPHILTAQAFGLWGKQNKNKHVHNLPYKVCYSFITLFPLNMKLVSNNIFMGIWFKFK